MERSGLLLGICIGAASGIAVVIAIVFFFIIYKRRSSTNRSSSWRRPSTIPIRPNGEVSSILSDSTAGFESPRPSREDKLTRQRKTNTKNLVSNSGLPQYSFRDLQKATNNFTAVIGQGASGTVYKAKLPTGETVAVKMLEAKSREGEKEFLSEVLLLGRLHHKNLVNLIGYSYEKEKSMLIYLFMPNGSLASHLYGENNQPLSWDLRVSIALDVARGVEYLHDGANPPVLHRDIKSNNILLDKSMAARVSDFGLSSEEAIHPRAHSIRGTYGYLDPEYVSTRTYTKKSDIYSYGVLLFELIAARNPQQGLMDYVELAALNAGGKGGWEEIADPNLNGIFDFHELNKLASLAYKCIFKRPNKRPSMRDIVQKICYICKIRHGKGHHQQNSSLSTFEGDFTESDQPVSEHHREDSNGSLSDLPDV